MGVELPRGFFVRSYRKEDVLMKLLNNPAAEKTNLQFIQCMEQDIEWQKRHSSLADRVRSIGPIQTLTVKYVDLDGLTQTYRCRYPLGVLRNPTLKKTLPFLSAWASWEIFSDEAQPSSGPAIDLTGVDWMVSLPSKKPVGLLGYTEEEIQGVLDGFLLQRPIPFTEKNEARLWQLLDYFSVNKETIKNSSAP